jgi:hypothetical protein
MYMHRRFHMTVRKRPAVILLLLIFLPLAHVATGAESEIRNVSSFDGIRASGLLEVILEEGSGNTVRVVVEGTSLDEVVTENDGNTLNVRMKAGILYDEDEVDAKAYVSYSVIRDINIVTGATVTSGSILRGDKVAIEMTTGGKADLKLDVNTVDARVVKGSVLTLSGNTGSIDATVNLSAELHAYELSCDRVYIRVNSGAVAEVTALKEIEGSAGSGGTLRVKGNPSRKSFKKSLGGTVREM